MLQRKREKAEAQVPVFLFEFRHLVPAVTQRFVDADRAAVAEYKVRRAGGASRWIPVPFRV